MSCFCLNVSSSDQSNALSKYEGIWASYQAKYESKEKFKQLKKKREDIQVMQEHSECISWYHVRK